MYCPLVLSSCKVPLYLSDFSENSEISNFMKIPSVAAELFLPTDRQTDRHYEANSVNRTLTKAATNRVLPRSTVCSVQFAQSTPTASLNCVLRAGTEFVVLFRLTVSISATKSKLTFFCFVLLQTRPVCYSRHGGFSSRYSHPSTRPT